MKGLADGSGSVACVVLIYENVMEPRGPCPRHIATYCRLPSCHHFATLPDTVQKRTFLMTRDVHRKQNSRYTRSMVLPMDTDL